MGNPSHACRGRKAGGPRRGPLGGRQPWKRSPYSSPQASGARSNHQLASDSRHCPSNFHSSPEGEAEIWGLTLCPSWVGTEASPQLEAGLSPREAEQFGPSGGRLLPTGLGESGALSGAALDREGAVPSGTLDDTHPNSTLSVREQGTSAAGRGPGRPPLASRIHGGLRGRSENGAGDPRVPLGLHAARPWAQGPHLQLCQLLQLAPHT